MKKVLSTALVLGALYTQANALEIKPYVGADVEFHMVDLGDVGYDDSAEFNLGINLGSKLYFNDSFFAGLEGYYRFLNTADEEISGEKLEIKNPWGFKVYTGYQFNNELSAFVAYGFNREELEIKDEDFSRELEEFGNSIGLGVNYKFASNLEARFTYDYVMTSFDDADLNSQVFTLGVNYLF